MTDHLYDYDAYLNSFEACVLSCTEAEWNKQPCYAVILDKTAFFPEQGGQDSDGGTIAVAGDPSVSAFVLHVSIKDEVITHFCDRPIPADSIVRGTIDFEARYDRMQQHSGEHLVSGYVNSRFGYDNVGFHLGALDVTLDFNGTFTDDELREIEDEVNRRIYANVSVKTYFPSKEELERIPYRSKKELSGRVRIVEFPGFDICACCAPHVRSTGEIGQIKIIRAEHFKGGTRITIMCGMRALRFDRDRLDDCVRISRQLSSLVTAVPEAVERLAASCDKLHLRCNSLETRLLSMLADEAIASGSQTIVIDEANQDIVREAVNRLTKSCSGYSAAYIGTEETGYRFIIGSSDKSCRDLIPLIREQGAKGGGSNEMIMGTAPVILKIND